MTMYYECVKLLSTLFQLHRANRRKATSQFRQHPRMPVPS